MKAPLKWHGGKYYLAAKIHELAPAKYTTRVIPYAGGLQEFWNWKCPSCGCVPPDHAPKCPGVCEVVNDLYDELVTFYSVLRTTALRGLFMEQVALTPFSRKDFSAAASLKEGTPVEKAVAFFIRYRMSRQGLGQDFATVSVNRTRRGMCEQVSSWLSAIEGLPDVTHRLQTVLVECRPAIDLIKSLDSPNTFFYLDPPYLISTRVAGSYAYEMTDADHQELLTTLADIKGKFLLSGYPSEMYSTWEASLPHVTHSDISVPAHSSSATSKSDRTEVLWKNYE